MICARSPLPCTDMSRDAAVMLCEALLRFNAWCGVIKQLFKRMPGRMKMAPLHFVQSGDTAAHCEHAQAPHASFAHERNIITLNMQCACHPAHISSKPAVHGVPNISSHANPQSDAKE